MINFPTCKINLGLHILRRRNDGYHELETAMLELPFNDVLELIESEESTFTTSGLEIPGLGNLVLDAEAEFRIHKSIPTLAFHLHKLIPMGGGLGGGSSDAAFALKLMRDRYAPEIENESLKEMASKIGSDCAFFIDGGLQFATGRGEVLTPLNIDFKNLFVVLVNLGIHVSTKDAYEGVVPNNDRTSLKEILEKPIRMWKDSLVNDFEKSAFAKYAELEDIKNDLYNHGAIYASMTGSGSTIFGIFESEVESIQWSHKVMYEKYLKL
ncbi:4-(cytidine 5'-diphospho)-2-C-methyl-D-erythritol kinase [Fluviicola taffensis]|uniref:4-diphosphocytidyl-2-C-methyl-D-erythritol kinase n=1 Tax=Fluviicola taffensis (strain DSM 16823 / NCIMB 13979 / RW262) TaxID=755732 RepID=F2IGK5_FLUTR|nr:4-(cytidine 5'-diphospho)-2-C-methyl-D-erythritol kinase [Fluviicola taffensis]AEA42611.1 4-diphosphocytidyl-2-C-methyl-D-erythritolkinase [Fluviicola taffensis DSM 16823]